ncbi:kinesin-like protein KIN-7E [Mercurialis annua]|uniref:kinesin-like protein KIN-7E n=1 Tax=Mercurialis annua TaxID=3986 RepID=UPI00215F6EBF|nr:kinesin-like protein KIN-7E [Mercurialis annua]XP_050231266.1 kinesin-like protein KIN-7E [Mercurialis annua]XP_050231267.1 kinesin-like protein KIN-7E [Mercurialis annua]XP_050231268.1 kinesin-like protein KIN-7E [Mercurialis annua]XP_050231269.1 kinesin-like protein KIN-7E [Mercurialis annua]XP_050231270.1 kinesin-like protein KIN-7E [Mercurialis annua]XP_050231271.1 kinesin-like protein KIN-7E [Mercurialis annua]XP_055962024.1 kinesin-like protein KIN-7E [Mercurialis annua]
MGSIGGAELPKMEKMQLPSAREEKILVLVRLRPLSDKEILADEVADWECINDTTILYRNTLREGSTFPSAYTFDRVFRGDSATRQLYDEGAKEVALSVVNGINSSIFAYGQTSSGKTYTMMGITEYTVADIFEYIHTHEERAFVLKFSAIEIYNEAIRDLLSADSTPLRLLDDTEKGTVVEKVTEETLKDWNHLQELLSVCEAQRRIGETSLNEKSSRSHQILRLTIESSAHEFLGKENSTTLAATVNFVDLAGSERASQSLSTGARLKEGCHINRSLLTLSTVIRKLSKGRHGHINYRDSKLTRLLQPALGGNARTAIICTLSPARSHVEQTRNTLMFACCAKEVTNKAQVNVVMSDKALVKQLQKELARLESELRSPVPSSLTYDYAALLRKKDLQIQKMEKEMRDLTKQRDLAESRIEDLLRMIGKEQTSRNGAVTSHRPNHQARDTWEDQCSGSESSGIADQHYPYGGLRKFNMNHYDGDSGSNMEEPYHLPENEEDDSVSDATSSLMSIGKKIFRSNSGESTAVGPAEDADDYCREVQCIEIDETRRENYYEPNSRRLAITMMGDGTAAGQELSTVANRQREVNRIQNGFTYDMLDQRMHQASTESSAADMSSSPSIKLTRSWSRRENPVSTPPNGIEKNFTGRPESVRRIFPPLSYGDNTEMLSRNGSQSSLGSAYTEDFGTQSIQALGEEDIPSVQNFVEGLKEMAAKQAYEKQIVDTDSQETNRTSDNFVKDAKDVGLDPMFDAVATSSDWSLIFESQRREIFELWQTCNVSLVHRTYFFLLIKGDPTDSIYMEVELRRLSFLKETFSQSSQSVGGGRTITYASSIKALHRERGTLSKLMQKRLSEEERKRIYQKWGIGLNSKRRRLQLSSRLWSNTKDINHITESAAIVAKLVKFVEQGQGLKEMFGLSFTPPSSRRRSLGWTYSN